MDLQDDFEANTLIRFILVPYMKVIATNLKLVKTTVRINLKISCYKVTDVQFSPNLTGLFIVLCSTSKSL